MPAFDSNQQDLFQQLHQPTLSASPAVDLDIGMELRGAINTAIREAKRRGFSRDRIVDRMNELLPDLEREITKRQLDAWTASSKEYHEFPCRYLPAFCIATDCELPLRVLAHAIGFDLADAREQAALRLGQNLVQTAALKREQRDLQHRLGG